LGGFSSASKLKETPEREEPIQMVRPLRWQTPDFSIQYGKNLAFVGQPMVGKTDAAILLGYYNSEYKGLIKEAGYDRVIELMESDIMPEIRKIMVLETENNLLKALNSGIEKALFRPFIEQKIIQVAPIVIPRKEVKLTADAKIISIRRQLIEELKEQFDNEVKAIVADEDEHTLFIIDSMSSYKKLLDDKFGLLYEVLNKRDNAVFDGIDTYRQSYYASRNTWWENLMQVKRGYKGWQIDTYKESETPEHWLKPGEDPYRIKWITGTEHNLDMVYRISKDPAGIRRVEILNGRYSPENYDDHQFMYPLNSKMGAMPVIDAMAEKLLLGEIP